MLIDPLLRYFRLKGRGSWSSFASAVEAFAPDLDGRSLARGLSEHSLIEFDYERLTWSVAPTTIVSVRQQSGGRAFSAWGGSMRPIKDVELLFEPGTRTIHTWSGDVEYSHALRIKQPSAGWPRSWEPTEADGVRDRLPTLDAVLYRSGSLESRRSGDPLEFHFHSLSRVSDGQPARWVEVRYGARRSIDTASPSLWRLRHGRFVYTENGRAAKVSFEVGAWLAFRAWLRMNGVERGLAYDEQRKALYISAAPYLPVPYVRALMMSGARESAYVGDKIRVFHNVDASLRDWFGSLVGISSY